MYKRPAYQTLRERLQEKRRFIQVLAGPRQCGKTTLAGQVAESLDCPVRFASADEPTIHNTTWVEEQWETARIQAGKGGKSGCILVLDEIQKARGWSETVKRLWDGDTAKKRPVKVLILGSSPLLIQKGLTESLAGRFEVMRLTHWSFSEMHEAFGWTLDQYIYFGGYPGSAELIGDEQRWSRYIVDSLIETTLSRDILLLTRVDKPALFRQLFQLGCAYSGRILSYQKIVGQLQDAGNTTTLAHYIELLAGAGMLTGLQKFAGQQVRQRGSSPKFQVLNTALISAQSARGFDEARSHRDEWGRLVESAVGAHLVNSTVGTTSRVFYWREGAREVDFVLQRGKMLTAIEVKSGATRGSLPGMDAFSKQFRPQRKLLIGVDGIAVSEFLHMSPWEWFE